MGDLPYFVNVTRGNRIESRHAVDAVVVDANGRTVLSYGMIDEPVFPRSSIKALQAVSLIEDGAAARFALEERHLALACASHSGEAMHCATATDMLQRAGLGEDALECGAQPPRLRPDRQALQRAGQEPGALHNNCSGKHAGMLCCAVHAGDRPAGYILPDHPHQQRLARRLSEWMKTPHEAANRGIDGCSIPTYAVSLTAIAGAFADFVTDRLPGADPASTRQLRNACFKHPEMVAGTGRACTDIMRAFPDRVFVKSGAEGVYIAAFPERGEALAIKVLDGAGRASEAAVAAFIAERIGIPLEPTNVLGRIADQPMHNWNRIEVGRVSAPAL